jgi:hypothetical protein
MDKKILEFLVRAKKATYAGNGPRAESSRPNSYDLHYVEDDLKYIDSFFGSEVFAGQEALWRKDKPFWVMNYMGRVKSPDEFSGDFLKEALLLVTADFPLRGPAVYEKDDMTYTCKANGHMRWFNGFEVIRFGGKRIYECHFHGGECL